MNDAAACYCLENLTAGTVPNDMSGLVPEHDSTPPTPTYRITIIVQIEMRE